MAKITVSMGGRAAEEVVMDTMTNGASQDIQDATNVARNMVAMFGMSEEFGMMWPWPPGGASTSTGATAWTAPRTPPPGWTRR